jgi:hypothetical protein
MNNQLSTGWITAILTLIAYFAIGILMTGEVALLIGVLLLVLVAWFASYRVRYKTAGNLELATRAYADFKEAVERIVERVAQREAQRRAAVDSERQARIERGRQARIERGGTRARSSRPTDEDPAVGRYADIIESRVREAESHRDQSKEPQE